MPEPAPYLGAVSESDRQNKSGAPPTDIRPEIRVAARALADALQELSWDYIGGERVGARPWARRRLLIARQRIDSILDTMHDEIEQEIAADCARHWRRDGVHGCACCGLDRKYGLTGGLCEICVMRGHEVSTTQRDLSDRPSADPAHSEGPSCG